MNNYSESSASKQDRWILALCPKTGEEVVGSSWHRALLNLESLPLWWYCPACKSWHVQVAKVGDDKPH